MLTLIISQADAKFMDLHIPRDKVRHVKPLGSVSDGRAFSLARYAGRSLIQDCARTMPKVRTRMQDGEALQGTLLTFGEVTTKTLCW